ncbi:MAG: NADH-quinone oxidoreductase subunit NuoE [Bacteroidales bacterium]|jgi:NADH-quinone oxidoreductase subunit E/NADP-reducing hydrogenase subunit HndA|nr:NADH-quinone oxidoreductase subunit NuoE [Bacteroidales bacterium]MDD2424678.1 NADH-quinone oxidoreductase subunit NuoE [Bacteroidales bacterium]MDD3989874.1 NADH-quinone oxidoreductase subunit NuoE [Bacteroidales bacterium]MDD4638123.1 NADH-quinone oxidoreductase subunit NuoE [Bacteroidales bacterium]
MGAFKIQECHKKSIADICTYYHNSPGDLIKILYSIQKELGFLPEDVQREVAHILKISVARVYGVVSFYSFFTMTPKGRHPISVCMGTACYVRGGEKVLDELKNQLKIKVGGVTDDGKFSLDCLRCVGACGLAPVMLIGDKVYGRVDPLQIKEILDSYE